MALTKILAVLYPLLFIDKTFFVLCATIDYVEITQAQVTVSVGEKIEVVCRTVEPLVKNFSLQWEAIDGNKNFQQSSVDRSSTLSIHSAKMQDSGRYRCVYKDDTGKSFNKSLQIIVNEKDEYTDPTPKENTETEEDQMLWLKTTVYTVIACTVGIVLLISIVAIAIFRIKMKRSAVRRAFRQAERRRQHASRCEGQGSHHNHSRARRQEFHEHEPFISAPSPTHFGNIIVNVNNGVQYVPNSVIQSPPSYAEVLAEAGAPPAGRHSPPPEYSTIDRNPNRLSDIPVSQSYSQNLSDSHVLSSNSDGARAIAGRNEGNVCVPHCGTDMQLLQGRDDSSRNQSSSNSQTFISQSSGTVTETNSLGRRSCRGQNSRQARNVRTVGSPWRPKQLKVLDGQIVLDESSSDSSSPDTINRNTQTNTADIVPPNENAAKPAQIQVQDGQIILANESTGDSACETQNLTEEDCAMSTQGQGQIEVKDGFIVFRSVGTST